MCFSCGKTLHWHELVPLASFLVQGGKCKGCKSKISSQYPIVEGLTGFIFLLVFLKFAVYISTPTLFLVLLTYAMYMWSLLLVISVYDYRHKIIPDSLVYVFIALSLFSLFVFKGGAVILHFPSMISLVAGPVLAFPFFLLWYFSDGNAFGLGDVKLIVGLGYFLGFGTAIAGLMLSFWIGAIVSIVLLIVRRKVTLKSEVPFGPFLVLGSFIAYLGSIDLMSLVEFFGSLL